MKFYLSSFKLGNETEKLRALLPNGRIGFVPNALDFTGADPDRKFASIEEDMAALRELGAHVELVNLRDYFGKQGELAKKFNELRAIFICGGNVFVLRQAMMLSGADEVLKSFRDAIDFLYAGYSAAGCVLAPSLKAYAIVDPVDTPYPELKDIIWDGLGLVDFAFMPHWNSDHPKSADIEKEIEYCRQSKIPYRAIRDGEVLIIG